MRFPMLIALGVTLALPAPNAGAASPGERPLTLDQAIAMALQRNDAIVVEREAVASAEAAVSGARGAYDPNLEVTGGIRRATDPVNSLFSGAPPGALAPTTNTEDVGATLRQLFSTGGSISVVTSYSRVTTDNGFTLITPSYNTRIGAEFRQPLLRNRAIDPARLGIRVAASDRRRAGASLQREVAESVAAVERAYWSLIAARRELEVREEAVRLASEQLDETKIRVDSGASPETELAQPRAELERRRGELLASREAAARADSSLKLLILGDADGDAWTAPFTPSDDPEVPIQTVDLAAAMEKALASRPELEAAAAVVDRRKIESVQLRDTARPALDAVVSFDRYGLSGWRNPDAVRFLTGNQTSTNPPPPPVPGDLVGGWGNSFRMLAGDNFDDLRAGFQLSIPILNRSASASVAMAGAAERQAQADLSKARKDVRAEVLNAAAALDTTGQRIEASRAAREAAEIQLSAERDRFAAGLSTNFLVLTRQNDLSRARLDEIAARTDYRRALTEMARATGAILHDRRITVEESTTSSSSQETGSHG